MLDITSLFYQVTKQITINLIIQEVFYASIINISALWTSRARFTHINEHDQRRSITEDFNVRVAMNDKRLSKETLSLEDYITPELIGPK